MAIEARSFLSIRRSDIQAFPIMPKSPGTWPCFYIKWEGENGVQVSALRWRDPKMHVDWQIEPCTFHQIISSQCRLSPVVCQILHSDETDQTNFVLSLSYIPCENFYHSTPQRMTIWTRDRSRSSRLNFSLGHSVAAESSNFLAGFSMWTRLLRCHFLSHFQAYMAVSISHQNWIEFSSWISRLASLSWFFTRIRSSGGRSSGIADLFIDRQM